MKTSNLNPTNILSFLLPAVEDINRTKQEFVGEVFETIDKHYLEIIDVRIFLPNKIIVVFKDITTDFLGCCTIQNFLKLFDK